MCHLLDSVRCEECKNDSDVPYVNFNDNNVQLTWAKCSFAPVEIQSIMSKYKAHDENDDDPEVLWSQVDVLQT